MNIRFNVGENIIIVDVRETKFKNDVIFCINKSKVFDKLNTDTFDSFIKSIEHNCRLTYIECLLLYCDLIDLINRLTS